MPVLSVDLAYRRWSDLGVVILDREPSSSISRQGDGRWTTGTIHCEIVPMGSPGLYPLHDLGSGRDPVDPEQLAGRLNHLCTTRDIRVILLDGPQAWKSVRNGLEHARVSERQLNTAAKTGLPGMVKPTTYRAFAEFCLDVYEALCRRGWSRLDTSKRSGKTQDRVLVESYPHAAWKSLGLKPLPAKHKAKVSDLARAYAALHSVVPLRTNQPPNHDQLQAIVGGLPGLALDESTTEAVRIVGNPPRHEEGHWREGFIVLPLPPRPMQSVRWLN